MPINREKNCSASVIFEKAVYEQLKEMARKNKRSISKQVAFMIEGMLATGEGKPDRE